MRMTGLFGALAVGAFSAGPVAAQVGATSSNLDFGLGGFMVVGLGYVDTDDGRDNAAIVRDGEVHFDGRLEADNGLTFGVDIEIEMAGAENTDEASGFVRGSFGTITIGEQDGAGDAFQATGLVAPPFTSVQDQAGFLFDYYDDFFDSQAPDPSGDETNDSLKISWFTPSVRGFSAGVSYVPEPGDEGGNAVGREGQTHAFELGAAYQGAFRGVTIAFGGGYTTDTTGSEDDDDSFGLGASLGVADIAVGAKYGWSGEGGSDYSTVGFGLTYTTGSWVAGVDSAIGLDGTNEDDVGVAAGASYALAPGVALGAVLEYGRDETRDADGFAAGVFMGLDF